MVLNMENLKVSVIIPVYNAEEFLEECLNSVINQTLKEIEIICVDDGSKDQSLNILEKYAQKDSRIKILTQHNRGPGAARNEALNVVNGEYVAFVDADDWIEKDSLKELYENSDDVDMVLFNAVEHLTGTENKKRIYPVDDSEKIFTYKDYKNLVMNSEIIVCSKLHKLSFIKENDLEFSNSGLYEDVFFHTKSMIRAKKLKHINKIFYNYRKTDENVRQSEYKATNESFILLDILDDVKTLLIKENVFEELEYNYYLFKIGELKRLFNNINKEYEETLYHQIQDNLMEDYLSTQVYESLPDDEKKFYVFIKQSDDLEEYHKLQNPPEDEDSSFFKKIASLF